MLFKLESFVLQFFILENNQKISLFSEDGNLIKSFLNIRDFSEFFNNLLEINIKLLDINEKERHPFYAGHLFMPFYIDQDLGWQNNWSSFLRVNFLKDWRRNIIDFFVGIKDVKSFEIDEEISRLDNIIKTLSTKLETCRDLLSKFEEETK